MKATVLDIYGGESIADWDAIRAAGIVGVIHKATEGATWRDLQYIKRRTAAEDAGLLWGAYHFATAAPVAKQVENFLSYARPDARTLICLDWENAKSGTMSLAQAKEWLERVMDKTGRGPEHVVIYGGHILKQYIRTDADNAFFKRFPLWLCHYGVSRPVLPAAWKRYYLWQFTDTGQLAGTDDTIDLNIFGGDAPSDLIKGWAPAFASITAYQESVVSPPDVPASVDEDEEETPPPSRWNRLKDWLWTH